MHEIRHAAYRYAVLPPLVLLVCGSLASAQPVPADFSVRLERTQCLGECPVYTVSIDATGTVTYDGRDHVRVKGPETWQISRSALSTLMAAIDRSGFADLREKYVTIRHADGTESAATDLPTTYVTVTRAGHTKRVEDYFGTPDALKQLEQQIDDVAGTRRVVRIDGATVEALAGRGWIPSPDEGAELLRRALTHDDVDAVRALVEIGVDVNRTTGGAHNPPLVMVRSTAAAKALLAAGADPSIANDNGFTALSQATYLAPEVTQTLLTGGARADQPLGDGRTALFYAACNGNIGVVKVLLAAGADPRVRSGAFSAADCARQSRDDLRGRAASPFDKWPFTRDFDAVIALLEQAAAERRR